MESFYVPIEVSKDFRGFYEEMVSNLLKEAIEDIKEKYNHKSYMNKKEASQYIGISFNTLQKFIERGLPIIEVDGVKLISKKDIDEFLERNKQ